MVTTNALDITAAGLVKYDGAGTFTGVTTTNHATLVGAASNGITSVGPSATAGQILQSGGAAADPSYSTATYPSTAGTSGKVLISDGTNIVSSTPTFPNASATSGKFIRSDGTNWVASTPTLPTTAGTSGKILISDGTNFVSSTPTYPNASATSGKILISDGTNFVASTPTFPNSASGTGTILRADGTNWVATTSTYPNTNAVNTLLYASSANVMSALATANSGVLTTDASGVPSIDTTNFVRQTTGMQMKGNNTNTAPPSGFIGEQITSGLVTAVSITTATPKSITSINITAGIWDVTGIANMTFSTSGSACQLSINTVNNTIFATAGDQTALLTHTAATYTNCTMTIPSFRVVLSGTTTYYLVTNCTFTGTGTANCRLSATRVG